MPLDPSSPSTPPTAPDPSTPPPPEPHAEAAWRRTFLAQFAKPADREALERFVDFLYSVSLSVILGAGYLGDRKRLFAADDLDAVADDLDALDATLREISEVPDQCGGAWSSRSARAATRRLSAWPAGSPSSYTASGSRRRTSSPSHERPERNEI